MKPIDIVVLVACILIVVLTIIFAIVNKKRGKASCHCDCSKCSKCGGCNINVKQNKK